jgi:quercetin dioxygenase-like cupin family protein
MSSDSFMDVLFYPGSNVAGQAIIRADPGPTHEKEDDMKKLLALFALALAAVTARADAPKPPSMDDGQVAQLADAKWVAPPVPGFPAGVMASPIAVDPATGGSIGYAKIPAGTLFPLHWHSANEYSVLLAGKGTFTIDGKGSPVLLGSYIVIPAKAQHKFECAAGADCILMTRRSGKTDYNWVK